MLGQLYEVPSASNDFCAQVLMKDPVIAADGHTYV